MGGGPSGLPVGVTTSAFMVETLGFLRLLRLCFSRVLEERHRQSSS